MRAPARFDPDAIRRAHPLEKVLEAHGVRLRRGRGPCPLCGTSERSTAFSVKGHFWRCFRCGAHGDVLDLVSHLEGITLRQAFARTAVLAGIRALKCDERPTPRAKPAWKIAREARNVAWSRFTSAFRDREWAASQFTYFHQRHGDDHPCTEFAANLLAESYDAELLAEYAYDNTEEDFP